MKYINLLCLALVKLWSNRARSPVLGNQIAREMKIDWREYKGNNMIQKFGSILLGKTKKLGAGMGGMAGHSGETENTETFGCWIT